MRKNLYKVLAMVLTLSMFMGCGLIDAEIPETQSSEIEKESSESEKETVTETESAEETESVTETESETDSEIETETATETETETATETESETTPVRPVNPGTQQPEITAEDIKLPEIDESKPLIVIDAGHQGKGNSSKEPDGPGSSTYKAKVTSGTTGIATGIPEYVINLEVALKLRDELEERGYQVVMIRENHDINISNSERAKVANNLNADAFIRLHCNGSDNTSVYGCWTMCQTKNNKYLGDRYEEFYKLAKCVLDGFLEATGCDKGMVWEVDNMSGINWAEVPTTIVEMGFMSNPEEDKLMATEEYQYKMVEGIANGIDAFLGRN